MAYTDIDKSDDYFNTVLYTGDGTSSNAITGVGFQPDFVWIKARSAAKVHLLHDVVRGQSGGEYYYLRSDSTNAESVIGDGSGLLSLDTDGFTVGEVGNATWNDNAVTYASWNWKANGTGVSNTDGSITSTVSDNTTSGFSIVTYTGTGANNTVGHGLGVTPSMFIVKERGASGEAWFTYHKSIGATKYIMLQSTNASATSSTLFQNTEPTSSVFSVGVDAGTNGSTKTYVAYCFAEKKGFSKFGSYTGNGSADGTFVYTGFKPAFLIVKRYNDAGYDWLMYDNKRQVEFNVVDDFLKPNLSDAETTGNANQSLDFLSNGVKFRGNGASSNGSGASYIYMCFAENPFVTSTGIPTTAR
jgi:hypothetical protein